MSKNLKKTIHQPIATSAIAITYTIGFDHFAEDDGVLLTLEQLVVNPQNLPTEVDGLLTDFAIDLQGGHTRINAGVGSPILDKSVSWVLVP